MVEAARKFEFTGCKIESTRSPYSILDGSMCVYSNLRESAIFDIRRAIYSNFRGSGSPINSKLRGGYFVAQYSIFGHKMTM